jgi:hypothetical protein
MQKIMDIRPQAPFKLRVASARDFGLFTRFASRRLQYLPAVVELKLEEYDFDPKVAIKYQELTSEADIASLLPSTLKFAHISCHLSIISTFRTARVLNNCTLNQAKFQKL